MNQKRGENLLSVIIAIAIFGLISLFFVKFYVSMNSVYQRMSVQSDLQRNLRILVSSLAKEVREASASLPTGSPILEPNASATASSQMRFSHVADPNDLTNPTFQTIRYTYDANSGILTRQVEGSGITRIICRNLSGLTFYYVNANTVRVVYTVSKTYKTADKTDKTVSNGGEIYLFARQDIH